MKIRDKNSDLMSKTGKDDEKNGKSFLTLKYKTARIGNVTRKTGKFYGGF